MGKVSELTKSNPIQAIDRLYVSKGNVDSNGNPSTFTSGYIGGDELSKIIPDVYNWNLSNYPYLRAGLGKMYNKARNCRVGLYGDSSILSYGSAINGGSASSGAVSSMDAQLARRLQAMGINASYQSWFGTHGITNAPTNWDSRLAYSGSMAENTALSIAGQVIANTAASTGAISFTPKDDTGTAVITDTCNYYYFQFAGGGTFSMQADSNTATNQSMNTSPSKIVMSTKTQAQGTPAAHTWKANYVSGSTGVVNLIGMEAYDSTKKCISLLNMGWLSSYASWWIDASTDYSAYNSLQAMSLDLALVSLGANELLNGISLETAMGYVQTFIDKLKSLNTDVIIVGYPPVNPVSTAYDYTFSYADQVSLNEGLKALSYKNGLVFIDCFGSLGGTDSWTINNTNGLMYDDLHRIPWI